MFNPEVWSSERCSRARRHPRPVNRRPTWTVLDFSLHWWLHDCRQNHNRVEKKDEFNLFLGLEEAGDLKRSNLGSGCRGRQDSSVF